MTAILEALNDALWEPEKKYSADYTAEHRAIVDALVTKAKAGDVQAASQILELIKLSDGAK